MQQALDALEYHTMQTRPITHTDKAIEALKEALAKPEQEPQMIQIKDGQLSYIKKLWVGLTDDEKTEIFMQAEFNDLTERQMYDVVEAKLKDKNTTNQ